MNRLRFCLAALLLAGASAELHAQAWPARPVRMVTPIAPGGAADILARIVADRLTRALGQTFVVENLPGASGVVGAQAVARAAPDGYTMFFAPASPLVSAQFTMKSLPYDPVRDFVPVATIVYSGPTVISVDPSVP